mmetsp:Transcript_8946/g.36934  ORF Transcript_8946/g.36934 Transcript_8946/m.36934 type:complete len:301 (+) Transcript_8946:56-958(+)
MWNLLSLGYYKDGPDGTGEAGEDGRRAGEEKKETPDIGVAPAPSQKDYSGEIALQRPTAVKKGEPVTAVYEGAAEACLRSLESIEWEEEESYTAPTSELSPADPRTHLTGALSPPPRQQSPSIGWSVVLPKSNSSEAEATLDIDSVDRSGVMRDATREELLQLRQECTDLFQRLKTMQKERDAHVDAILIEKNDAQAREIDSLKKECSFLYDGLAQMQRLLSTPNFELLVTPQELLDAHMTQLCARCKQEFLLNSDTACAYHPSAAVQTEDGSLWPCCNSVGEAAGGCCSGRHVPSEGAT